MVTRRSFIAGSAAAALLTPRLSLAQNVKTLRFIPQVDLTFLDPVFTTVYVTRNHGYMVFDTLYGMDTSFQPVPQMVEGHVVENDGLLWKLTLREGLTFHDGEPVRARDCVASIKRWAAKDTLGTELMLATAELNAPSDRVIEFKLLRPFPLLPFALGKLQTPMCAMMPERLALADAGTQITEMVGSGPYRFLADERIQGARNVYEKFQGYVPRADGRVEWTAGPKHAYFDRVEWTTMPDPATAVAALQTGSQDWWENPTFDLLPLLQGDAGISVKIQDDSGWIGVMRPNHTQVPFNNPDIRRAVFKALSQNDYMQAIVGEDPAMFNTGVGYFAPGTPMANKAGLDVLEGPRNYDAVRQEIIDAGYKGEKVLILAPADFPPIYAMALVTEDLFKKIGLNAELAVADWGATGARRVNRGPVSEGGWSVFFTAVAGSELLNPAGHYFMRGQGENAWFGWPDLPQVEQLRKDWLAAPDLEGQIKAANDIQAQAMHDVPYWPIGQYMQPTAYRNTIRDVNKGFATFWGVRPA